MFQAVPMTAFYPHHGRHPTDTTTFHGRIVRSDCSWATCPFDALSHTHRTLECRVSRLVQRVADGTGRPRPTFVRTAVALTALSFVPDLTFRFDTGSAATLIALQTGRGDPGGQACQGFRRDQAFPGPRLPP